MERNPHGLYLVTLMLNLEMVALVEVVVVTTTQEVLVFLAKVVMVDMVHKMVTSVLEVAVERTLLAVTAHQVTLETEVLLSHTS